MGQSLRHKISGMLNSRREDKHIPMNVITTTSGSSHGGDTLEGLPDLTVSPINLTVEKEKSPHKGRMKSPTSTGTILTPNVPQYACCSE